MTGHSRSASTPLTAKEAAAYAALQRSITGTMHTPASAASAIRPVGTTEDNTSITTAQAASIALIAAALDLVFISAARDEVSAETLTAAVGSKKRCADIAQAVSVGRIASSCRAVCAAA